MEKAGKRIFFNFYRKVSPVSSGKLFHSIYQLEHVHIFIYSVPTVFVIDCPRMQERKNYSLLENVSVEK